MTARLRSAARAGAPADTPAPSGGPTPVRVADLWVSAAAVRQAIGAWAYTSPARAGADGRPDDGAVRSAIGVACAIAECAAAVDLGRGGDAPGALTRPVPADAGHLGELAGVPRRDAERALALLEDAGVVRRATAGGAVALDGAALTPVPAAARIAWAEVRARLAAVGGGVAAPLAVLRVLAERVGAVAAGAPGGGAAGGEGRGVPPVRASARELEEETRFGRSTVSEAVAALVRARVIDADTRPGHTGRFVVRPAAFGLPDEAPVRPSAAAPAVTPVPGGAPDAAPRAPAPSAPSAAPAPALGAAVLVGTFAGTPIYAPPGTPLVVECDAEGRWVCRVGPYLQLGPAGGPAGGPGAGS